jgi:signal transduction histidine kinase
MIDIYFKKIWALTEETFRNRSIEWDVAVFVSYFLGVKLAQYILFTLDTSPALIWAPTGIALAAVLIKGNSMWLPIFLAQLAGTLTHGMQPIPVALIVALGAVTQAVIGAAILRQFRSNGSIHRTRDVIVLVLSAFFIAGIGPLFSSISSYFADTLTASFWVSFTRSWAGGLLSIIIVTPFIVGWYHSPTWPIKRSNVLEAFSAFALLVATTYLLFWTTLAQSLAFLLIFFLCAALFWIAFRFGSRINVSALMFLTVFGILGSIVTMEHHSSLNQQLFADELFIIIIAPIFYLFFTLMEERRIAEGKLEDKIHELQHMSEQLKKNDRAKNEFIAVLAHELRNPLSTIVTSLELLKLEHVRPEGVLLIEQGELQTHTMRRLLEDLLDVARIAEKKFTILKEPTEFNKVVQRAIASMEHAMRIRRHTLTVHLCQKETVLMIDPVRIEQVINNLLTNAAKYTPPGGNITLTCTLGRGSISIEVSDDGQGIPKDSLEKIFSPFQQLDQSSARTAGVGIGLFLTRQIVELHGGTVSAESGGAGKGSTFIVHLPIESGLRAVKKPETSNQDVLPGLRSLFKILIVDDNEPAAIGLAKLLELKGYHSNVVHTGKDALVAYASFDPHIILLDLGLPDMHGLTVGRKIRSMQTETEPVLIALTGYGQAEDKTASLAAGFDYHLTKPVGIAEIESILVKVSEEGA